MCTSFTTTSNYFGSLKFTSRNKQLNHFQPSSYYYRFDYDLPVIYKGNQIDGWT